MMLPAPAGQTVFTRRLRSWRRKNYCGTQEIGKTLIPETQADGFPAISRQGSIPRRKWLARHCGVFRGWLDVFLNRRCISTREQRRLPVIRTTEHVNTDN